MFDTLYKACEYAQQLANDIGLATAVMTVRMGNAYYVVWGRDAWEADASDYFVERYVPA